MKAKKILIEMLGVNHKMAEEYNTKLRFAQFENNQEDYKIYTGLYKKQEQRIKELKEAIQEIESLEVAA